MPTTLCDYLIVGGGIAGASIGNWLARHGRVCILEGEEFAGYHSTGRSAAMVIDSYGPPQVRALTRASRLFLTDPPMGFGGPLLRARGALVVAAASENDMLLEHWRNVTESSTRASLVDATEVHRLIPVLRADRILAGVFEPDAADIDVHALHQGFLRQLRAAGGQLLCNAKVQALERADGDKWRARTTLGIFMAPVVVNAAGAWCDEVAQLAGVRPIGIVPKRRSAFIFAPPAGLDSRCWPLCAGAKWDWYMKPEAGLLLGSPANADPVPPHDVQPEDMDIALGIDSIETWTTLRISRPVRTWAGLRAFVEDGDIVAGYDDRVQGFFWLAGQGGYGVQTCAALGECAAALVRGECIPPVLESFGIAAARLSPSRLLRE